MSNENPQTEMPAQEAATATPQILDHDFAQSQVPVGSRRGFWSMFVIMLGFTFFSSSMWTGANLGAGLTMKGFWTAMLIGNLILGVYTAALAWIAADSGLSVHLLSRRTFGQKGSWLPSFLLAFTQIGWFGVGVAMFAIPVQTWLNAKGINCNVWIPVIISGLAFTSSAYFGIKALSIISIVAVPIVAFGGGFSMLKVFFDNPDAWNTMIHFTPDAAKALTISTAIGLTVGNFVSGGTCTPDFVRFAKSKKIAVATTAIAFFLGNSLMFLFGAVGAMFYNKNDISEILVLQNPLVPGIIVLGLNIWTTNDNALYTSGLGLANITGLPKKAIVLFNGILGTVLAVWLYNNFCGWLSMLNTTLPPIGAVLIADFFLNRGKGERTASILRWQAVVSWAIGVAVANFVKVGISSINGMIAAVIAYAIFNACCGKCCCQCGCQDKAN